MDTILRILRTAGGWSHGLQLRIEKPPYMGLVIEATDESGPCGLPAISVAQYGEQNGDAMRDPEMLFELGISGFGGYIHIFEFSLFYWRNDYAGVEQWSRYIEDGVYRCHAQLHRQHERFAELWDKNLRQQGFAEAHAKEEPPNRTNLTTYVGNVQSAFFGQPTAAAAARKIQFTGRIKF